MKTPFIHRIESLDFVETADFDYAHSLINTQMEINPGHYILNESDVQKKIHFVLEGWGITYKCLEDGRRQILNFVLPGDIIGLFSPIYQRSIHTVESITAMNLATLPADRVLDTFRDAPRLALVLAWMAGQDERILEEQIVRIGRRRATKRMAHLFVELHRRLRFCGFNRDESISFPLNQLLLSDALGLSHIHSHRVFRELIQLGLIERTSTEITLINLPQLAALADFDATYLEPVSLTSLAEKL